MSDSAVLKRSRIREGGKNAGAVWCGGCLVCADDRRVIFLSDPSGALQASDPAYGGGAFDDAAGGYRSQVILLLSCWKDAGSDPPVESDRREIPQ